MYNCEIIMNTSRQFHPKKYWVERVWSRADNSYSYALIESSSILDDQNLRVIVMEPCVLPEIYHILDNVHRIKCIIFESDNKKEVELWLKLN